MVQILPPKTDLGTAIGTALGGGLSQGMQQGSNIGFQKGLLNNAFDEALKLYKDPNISPIERNLGALKLFSFIPGSERYVPQALEMLNRAASLQEPQSTNTQQLKPFEKSGNQPQKTPPIMIQGQAVPEATEAAFPEEEVDVYEPYLGKGVKKYNPLEISAIEQRDLQNLLPNSPRADFMRRYNKDIENAVDRISDKQKEFANYYSTVHPNLSPDDQRIAQKFYRTKEALKAPTNEEKTRVVDNFVDRYRNLRNNIANQTPRSLIGKLRSQQEGELSNQIDWLLKEGQRDLAKEYLTSTLGFGDSESERIIKKPTKQQEDSLSNFPRLSSLDINVPTFGKDARSFQTHTKERSHQLEKYESKVKEAIQPGTAKDPGTSLLVLRDIARDKVGITWVEFNDMVNKLYREGKIKLDPYQTQELPKLTSPPHAGFLDMLIERK
jgi:hypothetical protein